MSHDENFALPAFAQNQMWTHNRAVAEKSIGTRSSLEEFDLSSEEARDMTEERLVELREAVSVARTYVAAKPRSCRFPSKPTLRRRI